MQRTTTFATGGTQLGAVFHVTNMPQKLRMHMACHPTLPFLPLEGATLNTTVHNAYAQRRYASTWVSERDNMHARGRKLT